MYLTNEEVIRVWKDMEGSVYSKFILKFRILLITLIMFYQKTLRRVQSGSSTIPYNMIELQLMRGYSLAQSGDTPAPNWSIAGSVTVSVPTLIFTPYTFVKGW